MGQVVADASAITDFIVAGSRSTPFDGHLTGAYDLHAPEVCDVEVLSAVRRGLVSGSLSEPDARRLMLDYATMPLQRHRHLPLLGRAFELYPNIIAADAMYVVLAERLDATLLTADRRLARAVMRHTAVPVVS